MPKVNHNSGRAKRNPPPPPTPPSSSDDNDTPKAEGPKKPSFAWRAVKFVAIAAIGGVVTTVAVDKFKQWTGWGKKEGEERNPGEMPDMMAGGLPQMPMMPGVTAFPVPWPTAAPIPPAPPAPPAYEPEPRRNKKKSRWEPEEILSPDEIYQAEMERLARAKARKRAHEDFENMTEEEQMEDVISYIEEYGFPE